MATICFRPPPLPPNKKSNATTSRGNNKKGQQQQQQTFNNTSPLSSTYLSFRDPSEDFVVSVDNIELKYFEKRAKRGRRVSHTNSLNRGRGCKTVLTRSHSEGNLDKTGLEEEEEEGDVVNQLSISRYMRVLSGSWKNLLNLGGMSRPPKPAATAKKVAPPAVPHEFRHSGSSFGSAGYGSSEDGNGGFLAPTDSAGGPRDDHSDYGSTVSGSTGKSPGAIFPAPAFTFPGQPPPGAVLTHKAAVYYHHQLSLQEDQGIDMTQSPGRDSPGSSSGSAGSGSRHSTASLDSGRASYHPLSTAGRSTIGSSNSPRCSLSSCSIGSDQGRIERMIHQGVPDQEIIHSWLVDLQFEEYFPLFVSAGYDLPTIGRMTPEDLTAVGIKKPNHRKKLKAEIAQLNLPDNLPEFIPGSLEEWLNILRLDEYLPAFIEQGYQTIDDVTQLTWEDLEEFGIVKLGHQKKIMLAIKRIKDVKAGKRIGADSGRIYATQIRTGRGKSLESLEDPNERTHHTFSAENTQTFYYNQPIGWRPRSYDDGDITPTNETSLLYEGGGTLPRPRGIIRPRPIAKITAKARETFPDFEKPQFHPEKYGNPQYKTMPNSYIQYGSPMMGKKIPPNPPKRRDSECTEETTTVEIHHVQTSSPLPLPAYPSSDSLSISLDSNGDLPLPPPPAPGTPPGVVSSHCKLNSSQSWGAEEQELIKTLALQHRNGSDASFKSSSSTESDSLPFANENAGTIRTRAGAANRQGEYSAPKSRPAGLPTHPSPTPNQSRGAAGVSNAPRGSRSEPADVLNDIGNMLANLTDELDAMLEEEKRQQ
ncbi:caskin-2 isoform X3 [Anthonomus grandis grandis]|uniref:caskin-2 isoform X3 n=1 Tax=Anthonomus grandis grandis TaxID=2921223 RepID=UPI00216591F8|nr:caskin-2 isoform X3 [Anthonomus grandis grandis]